MRRILALVVMFYSAAAMAQSSPPTVGDKPLVQVKPKEGKAAAKDSARNSRRFINISWREPHDLAAILRWSA